SRSKSSLTVLPLQSLALALAAWGALGASLASCHRGGPLGVADAYLLFAPAQDEAGRPRISKSGLPLLDSVPLDDPRAVPYHKLFAVGFAAEMLRSDYLLKQL